MILRLMNLSKYSILMLLMLFTGSVFIIYSTEFRLNSTSINENKLKFPSSSKSYVVHAPILIGSNGDFGSYNFSGVGTRQDPYLIEGYNISAQGAYSIGIEISGTNAFFIINGCVIYSDWVGVQLGNLASGSSKVLGNKIFSPTGDGGGISIGNMQNCTISDNICSNFMQGIHLNHADDCIIVDNYFYDLNYQGINIRYSDSNIISFNRIRNAKEHAIALVGTSSYNIIHHNNLEENTWSDTYDIDGTPKGEPTSQGYDEGSQNTWYDSENQHGNTWSDYFGIGPYQIDGPANSIDLYPKHTTGFTLFGIIISTSSITIGLVVVLLIYRFNKRRRKN